MTADGRLRLLVVSHSLAGGGAERFASNLLGALDRERFAPELALAVDRVAYPLPDDVVVHRLGYDAGPGVLALPGAMRRLGKVIAARRPDVVLSNVLATNCLTGGALVLGGLAGPAWVARVGNAPEVAEPAAQRAWARAAYPRARFLVANSAGMLPALRRRYPDVADRCRALANPTDFEGLDRRAGEVPVYVRSSPAPLLLWVGRLTAQKRPDLMLEALAELSREVPPSYFSDGENKGILPHQPALWMCGEGPLEGELRRRAQALGVADQVAWLGFVANPFPLMAQADLFVLTSDFEGLPNALIEAQGAGLPAVATRCPHGPDEIVVNGVTGRLVPPGDSPALARAARELLSRPESLRRMGREARARARERYGLAPLTRAWEDLLVEACRNS